MASHTERGPLPSPADLKLLADGRHPDPFAVLGRHSRGDYDTVVTLQPGAESVHLIDDDGGEVSALRRIHADGVFAGRVDTSDYRFRVAWPDGAKILTWQHRELDHTEFDRMTTDLWSERRGEARKRVEPLPVRMRPRSLDEVAGQRIRTMVDIVD